jgi:TRAP-type C4-dicarboxylate transport system substrate-binding protein
MRRLVAALGITSSFAIAWFAFEEIPLVVLGQPTTTGKVQSELEEPFFRALNDKSGIKFRTEYTPINKAGYRDTHQLQLLKGGKVDIASVRFAQNSQEEPSLQGIDMAGLIDNFEEASEVSAAYSGAVDKQLRLRFGAKLLGVWTFGPMEIFCNKPVRRLQDLRGLRVRTSSQQMSSFIVELGAKPAVIDFSDTAAALKDGLVDCGITSKGSASHAKWSQHAKFNYPFAIQFGFNGYAITLKKWDALTRDQQSKLQQAFDEHVQSIWRLSKDMSDASNKSKGSESLVYRLDRALARQIMEKKILPNWEKECKVVQPSCRIDWNKRLLKIINSWASKETHSNI